MCVYADTALSSGCLSNTEMDIGNMFPDHEIEDWDLPGIDPLNEDNQGEAVDPTSLADYYDDEDYLGDTGDIYDFVDLWGQNESGETVEACAEDEVYLPTAQSSSLRISLRRSVDRMKIRPWSDSHGKHGRK